jgi:hypothetical protein
MRLGNPVVEGMAAVLVAGLVALGGIVPAGCVAAEKVVYQNDFEKAEPGELPEEFLVLDGAFEIKQEGNNKFIELPGAPLETFGVLFGPSRGAGTAVTARIHGTGKGRRFPSFGVSLLGVGGYRLMVSPSKKAVEIYRGDEVEASVPFEWTSDAWTHFQLHARKTDSGKWWIEGKVWKEGEAMPAAWTITHEVSEEPPAGRAAIWGSPYAGTPIRFDDLKLVVVGN